MCSHVLCSCSRLALTQKTAFQALTVMRVSRTRRFFTASSDETHFAISHTHSGPRTVWPDDSMGPFAPQDQRFQLPGNVGFDCHLAGTAAQRRHPPPPAHRGVPDVLSAPSSSDRHDFILAQLLGQFQVRRGVSGPEQAERYFAECEADCHITLCPALLRQDLERFFPVVPSSDITIVTVTQRSPPGCGETPRSQEQLLVKFVSGAREMCAALWEAGYWADFIHPETGIAFFGSAWGQVAPPPDGELVHAGVHVQASGSCTLIVHVPRGGASFVGTVFTDAPTRSPAVARLRGPRGDDQ